MTRNSRRRVPYLPGAPMQASRKPSADFPWTLEVALSGGGLRAAAYALGALLYLVHSGLYVRVKNISSVSGGSITNAFVACDCDFQKTMALPEFQELAGRLARQIAFNGLLQRWQSWVWGLPVAIIAMMLPLSVAVSFGNWSIIIFVVNVLVTIVVFLVVLNLIPWRRIGYSSLGRLLFSGLALTVMSCSAKLMASRKSSSDLHFPLN